MITRMDPETILIHFHVGKTGGTTFGSVLGRLFPLAQQFDASSPKHDKFGIWDIEEIGKK
jgi:hypothetical protein